MLATVRNYYIILIYLYIYDIKLWGYIATCTVYKSNNYIHIPTDCIRNHVLSNICPNLFCELLWDQYQKSNVFVCCYFHCSQCDNCKFGLACIYTQCTYTCIIAMHKPQDKYILLLKIALVYSDFWSTKGTCIVFRFRFFMASCSCVCRWWLFGRHIGYIVHHQPPHLATCFLIKSVWYTHTERCEWG